MAVSKKIKLSDRKHPLYEDNEALWEFYLRSIKGGYEYIWSGDTTDGPLFSHRLEDSTDFDERQRRAYYLNFCRAVIEMYNTYIFKENVERPVDDVLQPIREDVDGRGTPMNAFMEKVGFFAGAFGAMHILLEKTSSNKVKVTKRDIKESNVRPYCSLVYPSQLIDWSIDAFGNFNWVLIKDEYYFDIDPTAERQSETLYKLIDREGWRIEDDKGRPAKFDDGTPSSGVHGLGFVPLVTMYHQDVDDDKVGESLIKDIVYVNRTIFNWCSCLDEQIERQTFSQLVFPDDGSLAEENETGGDPMHKIGVSSIITFPAASGHPPQFISPNVANISTIWTLIVDHIKEIYRMAKLIGASEDMYTSRSGRSAQFGFLGVNAALAEKAKKYEKFENDMARMIYKLYDKDPESYKDVKYAETFDVTTLADEITTTFLVLERNFSITLNKELEKRVARKALPTVPYDIIKKIESEIEAGDGHVEPLGILEVSNPNPDVGNPNSNLGKSFKTNQQKIDEETQKEKT